MYNLPFISEKPIRRGNLMTSEKFHSPLDIILLLGLYFLTAPQITVFLPYYSDAIMLMFTTLLLLYVDRMYLHLKPFMWLMLYAFIVIMNFFAGDVYFSNYIHVFEEIGLLLLPSAMFCYLACHNDFKLMKWMVILFFVHTIYVTVASSIIEAIEPGTIRLTVVWSLYGEWGLIDNALRHGLSSYMFPHALPIIIPALILGVRNKRFPQIVKGLLLLCFIATLYLIYLSSVATALLLAILIFIVSVVVTEDSIKNNLRKIILVGVILFPIFVIFLNEEMMLNVLGFFSSAFENTAFASKFVDMEQSIKMNSASGDIESRMNMYQITQDALAGNVLLGTDDSVGGHSALFDRLGALGLIGFIPYSIFLFHQIKLSWHFIPKNSKVYFLIGLLAGFVMLLTKNTSNWYLWSCMFLYMPSMIIVFSSRYEHKSQG